VIILGGLGKVVGGWTVAFCCSRMIPTDFAVLRERYVHLGMRVNKGVLLPYLCIVRD